MKQSRGIAKHLLAVLLVWVVVLVLFYSLYVVGRGILIDEVRSHVMGVAIAVSEGLNPDDLDAVRGPEDMGGEAFLRVQGYLDRVTQANPDVRFIYTMRRSSAADATPTDYEYVVDGPAADDNGNGVIDADEGSEETGTVYPAIDYPEMLRGWTEPAADLEITPDPPYPDMLSGYAPVKGRGGVTMALVGVDMIAATISAKLNGLRWGVGIGAILIGCMLSMIVSLFYRERHALAENRALASELTVSNDQLQQANQELERRNQQFREELKLAQTVQLGFLPSAFPRKDRIHFETYYMSCEIIGGDLYDVFEVGPGQVGFYVADVAGHGVSAALISGLLKMAMTSARESGEGGTPELMQPDVLLRKLHDVIQRDIPEYDYITMLYGVLDLDANRVRMANGGHLYPIHYRHDSGEVEVWEIPTGGAIGLLPEPTFECVERPFAKGDKLILYTDGLTEAMDPTGQEFGRDRFLQVLCEVGGDEPVAVVSGVRARVDQHVGVAEVSDDFTLLVAELR